MMKLMDGFILANDSTKPAVIATKPNVRATIAIVEDTLLLAPRPGCRLVWESVNAEGVHRIRLVTAAEALEIEAAQVAGTAEGVSEEVAHAAEALSIDSAAEAV